MLKDQVYNDLVEAMKARNTQKVSALKFIRAAVEKEEIARRDPKNKNHGTVLTDDDIVVLIKKERDAHEDTMRFAVQGNRQNIIDEETQIISYLDNYIPQPLTREQLVVIINSVKYDNHSNDFKIIMPLVAQLTRGKADGKMVSEIVREMTA